MSTDAAGILTSLHEAAARIAKESTKRIEAEQRAERAESSLAAMAKERDALAARLKEARTHLRTLVLAADNAPWVEDVAFDAARKSARDFVLSPSPADALREHNPLACPCCMAAAETTDPETHGHYENARDRRLTPGTPTTGEE